MGKVALLGAAGAIGTSVAEALRSEGTPYRVVGRSEEHLRQTFGGNPLAGVRAWNLDNGLSVRQALDGVETAIYLIGVNYWQFELHPMLMREILEQAELAGIKRMLLIGTVYPYGRPQSNPVTEDHPRNPHTFKGRMRKEQEDILFAAHEAGTIQACELRLPDFYGPNVDKSFLWDAFVAAKKGGRAQLVGPIDTPHTYSVQEIARFSRLASLGILVEQRYTDFGGGPLTPGSDRHYFIPHLTFTFNNLAAHGILPEHLYLRVSRLNFG